LRLLFEFYISSLAMKFMHMYVRKYNMNFIAREEM